MRQLRRVCVYCGSSDDISDRYRIAARSVGTLLASRGIGIVYGGGRVGMMGEVADAALATGGEVFGVIPEKLQALELGHTGCTELFVVDSMHARKMMMAQLSDAFIALPGGWGTMDEIFEVTTWTQLNVHRKPVGLLNVDGYYDHLLAWIQRANADGFIRDQHAELLSAHDDPVALLDILTTVELPTLAKWLTKI
jgi:uncharacterized protein (TIGR00730 family)